MRIHPLITKSEDLKALVDRLAKQPFIAVDTEFMRENTYWPDLCLIQVASTEEAAAIDPQAEGIDLKPLLDLFVKDEEVLKVFHAGGQDLEIIHNLTGKVPHPLFDTQIAAMALGHGEQIGYSNLIESLLATASTRARASPTGAGGPSTSVRSIMRSRTSPTLQRFSPAW